MPPEVGRARHWVAAVRPKTLPAALAPVIVGTAFAYADGGFAPLAAAAAIIGALFIQIGTNLANDYHDHQRGADTPDRAGPARATAMGWIPPKTVLRAAVTAFLLAAAAGVYLVWIAGWPVVVIGLVSIASGYLYTGGPYPLGYHGWGDAFVLVFFGPVAVGGTYFVQTLHAPTLAVLVAGAELGSLATAILVVNNVRDAPTDGRVGKRTLAVSMGVGAARVEYTLLLVFAFVAPLAFLDVARPWMLLPLLSLPFGASLSKRLWSTREAAAFNRLLARTAQLLLAYAILLAIGVVV